MALVASRHRPGAAWPVSLCVLGARPPPPLPSHPPAHGVLPSQAPTRGCCSRATGCGTWSATRRRASWCARRRRRSAPRTRCWARRSASATRGAAARGRKEHVASCRRGYRIHPAARPVHTYILSQMAAQPAAALRHVPAWARLCSHVGIHVRLGVRGRVASAGARERDMFGATAQPDSPDRRSRRPPWPR